MWSIYRKWMIIAILSGCVYVFAYSGNIENAFAAPCIQECESNQNECIDWCDYDCSADGTQEDCYSCLQACSQAYFQCLSYAVSCQGLDVTPGRCAVNFGSYCPKDIYGDADCSVPSQNYLGYSLQCSVLGHEEWQCVNCSNDNNYTCQNPNNLPPC